MLVSYACRMNLIARVLLIAALLVFLAFHLSLLDSRDARGWNVWPAVWNLFHSGAFQLTRSMLFVSGFLTFALVVVTAPFLITFLRFSKLCWWLAIVISGSTLACFGWLLIISPGGVHRAEPVLAYLLGSLILNFAGLLCIRREQPAGLL